MADRKSMKDLVPVKLPEGDKLDLIMKMQVEFMNRIGIFPEKLTLSEREKATKELLLADYDENSEILGWINWKPWKKKKIQVDQHEIRFEIIDKLHFLLEMAAIWGMTAQDIAEYYAAKNQENNKRQDNGY